MDAKTIINISQVIAILGIILTVSSIIFIRIRLASKVNFSNRITIGKEKYSSVNTFFTDLNKDIILPKQSMHKIRISNSDEGRIIPGKNIKPVYAHKNVFAC